MNNNNNVFVIKNILSAFTFDVLFSFLDTKLQQNHENYWALDHGLQTLHYWNHVHDPLEGT